MQHTVCIVSVSMLNKKGNTVYQKHLTDVTFCNDLLFIKKGTEMGQSLRMNSAMSLSIECLHKNRALCHFICLSGGLAVAQQPVTANHYK